ncbi:hypothetical protein D3C81_1752790 [compost metagenome]
MTCNRSMRPGSVVLADSVPVTAGLFSSICMEVQRSEGDRPGIAFFNSREMFEIACSIISP